MRNTGPIHRSAWKGCSRKFAPGFGGWHHACGGKSRPARCERDGTEKEAGARRAAGGDLPLHRTEALLRPQCRRTLTRKEILMSSSSAPLSTPEGPLSGSGAPNLPDGFTDTFTSRYVNAGGLRQHAVIGGEGPPLLLVHGWPENWYAWRLLMPALARDFEVIAVDQRGIGLSDKPQDGYDTGTLAGDLVALMDTLGHQRFAVVGHDTGHFISYALAADHPHRVDRVALLDVPGPRAQLPHLPCSSRSRSPTRSGTSLSTGSTRCPNSSSGDGKTSTSAMS